MKSQRWAPLKNLGLMKVRGGHPFGLMQIPRNAKFKWFKMQKNHIPYESQILGQLLDLICLAKINLFEPRLESYNPYDMAN